MPKFLIRRWTNDGGRTYSVTVRGGEVFVSAVSPKGTGFEPDLYSLPVSHLECDRHVVETDFFQFIDNGAANALQAVERQRLIDKEQCDWWAVFLSSLRMRQQDVIEALRTHGPRLYRDTLAAVDAESPPPGSWTTEQWIDHHFPGEFEATPIAKWLVESIVSPTSVERFSRLIWRFYELSDGSAPLLLSDRPLLFEALAESGDWISILPIAPNRLFLGATSDKAIGLIEAQNITSFVERINIASLAQSGSRLWAADPIHAKTFVQANVSIFGINRSDFGDIISSAINRMK